MFSYLTAPTPAQAHLWLTYGWLGVCGLAPVVVVLIIWAICMHYTYRQKWRTLDVLLATVLVQEIPNALVVLVIAAIKGTLIHLPRSVHTQSIVCYMLVWATAAIRFYQFAVTTSLIADRALILKWPYRYRFTIRITQIRIFLSILAVVASLVGAGAIYAHYLHSQSTPLRSEVPEPSLASFANQTSSSANSTQLAESTQYRFTFDPVNFERHFNYLLVGIFVFFALTSVVCFLYVECNRPRNNSSASKNRYLPSIATLFTTATTASSTSTSSSASSSLSASSPLPSRFSSLANLTAGPPTATGHSNQKSVAQAQGLPSFYYGNAKRDSKTEQSSAGTGRGADTLNSLYPISIVDMMSHENGAIGSSAYASMSTTDNSIYRLIDGNNGHSRSNSLNLVGDGKLSEHNSSGAQHRTGVYAGHSDPASSLDPINPSSRVNSFSKPHLYSASFQMKLNTSGSNDTFAAHRSAFDLRWSSVLGPATFCLAFNHGPYLIFTLLGTFGGIWTPFHDLILACLTLLAALFLPLIFFLSNSSFRNSVKKSCHCQSDKISSKSQHASLAFSDRKFANPPYLHSAPTKSNALGLSNYQSDLDLSKQDPPGSKLKSHFLSRHDLSKPSHATSMLDLSCRTPYHQQSGSRSRHSLALLHLPNNSPTPRSSFRRRPPSVASYNYPMYSSNQSKQNKYPQYLFGVVSSKSESTLPLTSNYYTPPSMVASHLKEIQEGSCEVDTEPKLSTISVLGSNLHLNQVPSITDPTRPVLSGQISEPTSTNEQKFSGSNSKPGPMLKELINGFATRSSFKRRSVRKCGSDASTFYTRRNLKRSQIAQNQLSSILYNNFYTKKLVPAFASSQTLLEDNERSKEGGVGKESGFLGAVSPLQSHLQARHLSYDFSQQSPMVNSHVYLPNTSHLELNNRSNSCNQLNGDYHNHLLVKQNFALMAANDSISGYSPRMKASLTSSNDYGQANAIHDDEHIYASLPEEEEEDETRQSGSFSARSTLPDNCQLIAYKDGNYCEQSRSAKNDFDLQVLAYQTKANGHLYGSRQHLSSSSSTNSSDQSQSPQSNSSSSTVDDTNEDIYEEVSHLIGSRPNGNELNADSRRRSASQDTLIEQMGEASGHNLTELQMSDDEDDDEDCGMDDDRISMLSEASSSTFSSFTTCANQDFEFIVSQTGPLNSDTEQVHTLKRVKGKVANACKESSAKVTLQSATATTEDSGEDSDNAEEIEPDTLSMAAIYYNRFILNESEKSKGHRQRPKVHRRQSFSTAYELRQRILVNQLNRERFEEIGMIEEENEPSLGPANADCANFENLLPYKLNRRISTSEDNLLSIISTIANCGDDQECLIEAASAQISSPRKGASSLTPSQAASATSKSNGTFVKKEQPSRNMHQYNKKVHRNRQQQVNSAIPRATNLPSPIKTTVSSTSPHTANISIKELKSKKQATKRPDANIFRPKSALHADRICELGSLWNNRPQTGSNVNAKPVNSRISATGKLIGANGSVTSSSSSSPSTPCRVPTFIAAPAVYSPRKFASKLSPPSQYTKQNARQNAILAKNALSADPDR